MAETSLGGVAGTTDAAAGMVRAPLALLMSTLRPSGQSVGVDTGAVGRDFRIVRCQRGLAWAAGALDGPQQARGQACGSDGRLEYSIFGFNLRRAVGAAGARREARDGRSAADLS